MASFTLDNTPFPDGTAVGAWDATGYSVLPTNGPLGTAATTSTAMGRKVTFAGLKDDTAYFAAAFVGGKWLWRRFVTAALTDLEFLEGGIRLKGFWNAETNKPALVNGVGSKGEAFRVSIEGTQDLGSGAIHFDPGNLVVYDGTTWFRILSNRTATRLEEGIEGLPLLPVFNVLKYGAVGDGVTVDSDAVLKAVALAKAAGGGIVYFPAGTYLIDEKLLLPSKVRLEGAGWVTSVLRRADDHNDHLIEGEGYGGEGIFGSAVQHLQIDGNKAKNSTGSAIVVSGLALNFHRVLCLNSPGDGINVKYPAVEAKKQEVGTDVELDFCRSIGCVGIGFKTTGHDTSMRDCQSIQCTEYGIYFGANGLMLNCHTWCYASDATCTKIGMFLKGNIDTVNCTAEGASEVQVQFSGSNNRWTAGDIFNSTGKPDAILVEFLAGENFGTHEINGANLHNFGNGAALKFTGSASNSKIRCHVFDPGTEKIASIGEPASSIIWDVTFGGTTKRGTIPGYHVQRRRTFVPFSGDIPNNTLYVNEAGELRWKNNEGVIKTVKVE